MVALSILCVIIVLVIVLFTDLGNRVPPDGLVSGAVDERPVRVRLDPPAEDPPRRPLRISRRGLIGFVALLAVTLVAAQSCQQAQVRAEQGAGDRDRAAGGRLRRPSARRSGSSARA